MKKFTLLLMMVCSSLAMYGQYGHRLYYADSVSNEWFNDGLITNLVLTNGEPVMVGAGRTQGSTSGSIERSRFVRARLSGTQQNNRKYFIFKNGAEAASRVNSICEGNSYFLMSGAVISTTAAPITGGADIMLMKASSAGVPSNLVRLDLGGGYDEALCSRRSNKSATNFYTCGYSTIQGVNRAFVMKHNNTMSTISWVRTFSLPCQNGATGSAEATSVIDDSSSNTVIVVGNVKSPTPGVLCQQAFIAKFSSSGALQWLRFITSPDGSDFEFQSIRETGVAQQYVITGSVNLPGFNKRVLLYTVNTAGAAPVTIFAKGLYSTGPTPNYIINSQTGYDVVTRVEPTKKEYFICGANQYSNNLTDAIIFKTDNNGNPLALRFYFGVGKEQYNAIDYVNTIGTPGNGIASFGRFDKIVAPGSAPKSQSLLSKGYFNLDTGCSEIADNPIAVNLGIQYVSGTISTINTYTKDTLTSQNSTVLQTTVCWKTNVSGGSNARVIGDGGEGIDEAETVSEFGFSIYPNPIATGNATVAVMTEKDDEAEIRIVDMMGRLASAFTLPLQAGRNEAQFSVDELPSGMYLVQLTTMDGLSKTVRLVKP